MPVATTRLLIHEVDRELLQPLVERLARPQTMPTTGRLDAQWQWVAVTKLVTQSTERYTQELGNLGISVVCGLVLLPCLHGNLQFDTFDNLSAIGITP